MKKAKPKKRAAGGGRKSSYGERTVSVSMRLPASSVKWVKAFGIGLTRGMVRVIEIAKQSEVRDE